MLGAACLTTGVEAARETRAPCAAAGADDDMQRSTTKAIAANPNTPNEIFCCVVNFMAPSTDDTFLVESNLIGYRVCREKGTKW